MTALANTRTTPEMALFPALAPVSVPVNALSVIYAGALVCLDSNGHAVPGTESTTLIPVGRAEKSVTGGAADGDEVIDVKPGVFKYENADGIAQTDVGSDAYVVDDQTVALGSGGATRSICGKIVQVDTDGVWVAVGLKRIFG